MTKLKICGLSDVSRAVAATEAGADFLGFVFVPGVRRLLTEDRARQIIQQYLKLKGSGGPRLVGLFADQPIEDVNRILRYCDLDLAQLCGSEPPEYWAEVEKPIIKQVKVKEIGSREDTIARVVEEVARVVSRGQTCLLDRYEEGAKGGTGQSFDRQVARDVAKHHPFMLAGGLAPENVAEAIRTAHPWGVDVSSGVETDGVKDIEKITAFAKEVRMADQASVLG